MCKIYEVKNLTYTITRASVLKAINCFEDSPVYEDFIQEYENIYDNIYSMVHPVGILGTGILPESVETEKYKAGTPIIYMVTSIGNSISQTSTIAFSEGNYVKGMLCDSMADDALFSMENQMLGELKKICQEHHTGILARLEAPQDISMEIQKEAWKHLELQHRFNIKISSGNMFDPVKTSCQIFVLTENTDTFNVQHDCRKCSNITCQFRRIPDTEITVHTGNAVHRIMVQHDESLLDALRRNDFYTNSPCGGNGQCGKCKIRILKGNCPATPEDKAVFSQTELENGFRLACRVYPEEKLEISVIQNDESQFEVLYSFHGEIKRTVSAETVYAIAIDIGSTTIAMQLLGGCNHQVLHSVTTVNSQRIYGADVISRIKASIDGKQKELQKLIRQDLLTGIARLISKTKIPDEKIHRIILSGNTTMGHLLMGYDCSRLGIFPFTPVNIDFICGSDYEILGNGNGNTQVTLLPGISTYVGGDIVSGLYACEFEKSSDICLLVDLGTNGELALGNRDKILVTSTAAGPAFEGGNISCGTGSIAGAICSVKLNGSNVQIKTIQDKLPNGICGTGVIEIVSELVRNELITEAGTFTAEFFETGFPLAKASDGKLISFSQKDIREVQLAKAAIRAGIETLLLRYGIKKQDVSRVYLAGGFGYKLDTSAAITIGMFPEEFRDRIKAIGNSSLAGAVKYLNNPNGKESIKKILQHSSEINLSADKDFNGFYMDSMFFESD